MNIKELAYYTKDETLKANPFIFNDFKMLEFGTNS